MPCLGTAETPARDLSSFLLRALRQIQSLRLAPPRLALDLFHLLHLAEEGDWPSQHPLHSNTQAVHDLVPLLGVHFGRDFSPRWQSPPLLARPGERRPGILSLTLSSRKSMQICPYPLIGPVGAAGCRRFPCGDFGLAKPWTLRMKSCGAGGLAGRWKCVSATCTDAGVPAVHERAAVNSLVLAQIDRRHDRYVDMEIDIWDGRQDSWLITPLGKGKPNCTNGAMGHHVLPLQKCFLVLLVRPSSPNSNRNNLFRFYLGVPDTPPRTPMQPPSKPSSTPAPHPPY
ncbi:hypothetical protein FB45DRAFT_449570 [Roridomyces roridus]|uniref:Uncharacterized protein n=1 Tax=Roridomyces roridus TaxID=1738132 RepID=A0AAD7C1P0_9AGAR|nr:hypothetical protein FB45DRAFT_449570 [Roridomyces roridus]